MKNITDRERLIEELYLVSGDWEISPKSAEAIADFILAREAKRNGERKQGLDEKEVAKMLGELSILRLGFNEIAKRICSRFSPSNVVVEQAKQGVNDGR